MPKLTVQNAEIQTATVEVRTLTLSGKQVTLSVFKQIEQAPIIQDDGTLAGEPWGRVNYHPDKWCARQELHHHVVWQHGAELRRATHVEPAFDTYRSRTADNFATAALFLALSGNRNLFPGGNLPGLGRSRGIPQVTGRLNVGDDSVDFRASDLAAQAYACFEAVERADTPAGRESSRQWSAAESCGASDSEWPEPAVPASGLSAYDRATERLHSALADLHAQMSGFGATATELLDRLQQELHDEAARRARHRNAWQEMCDLPQLFIAI